jgi:hypothetical protein
MVVSDDFIYIQKILDLYLNLPETPAHSSQDDIRSAHDLCRRKTPLEIVEAALLLGSVRRLYRDPALPRLRPIRSLRYFLPVIEEVTLSPLTGGYLLYLRYKLDSYVAKNSLSK